MAAPKFVKRPTGTTPSGSTDLVIKSYVDGLQMHRAYLRLTSATSLVTSTFTVLPFNLEDIDSAGGHSTVTNTSRYTCQVAGDYTFWASIEFAANATGARGGTWYKNGTEANNAQNLYGNAGGLVNTGVAIAPYMVTLAVNDYVEVGGFQSSGGNLNVSAARMTVMFG